MFVDGRRHSLVTRDHRITMAIDLAVKNRTFRANRGGAAKLAKPNTTACFFFLIADIAVSYVALLCIGRRMARAEKPVLDR